MTIFQENQDWLAESSFSPSNHLYSQHPYKTWQKSLYHP